MTTGSPGVDAHGAPSAPPRAMPLLASVWVAAVIGAGSATLVWMLARGGEPIDLSPSLLLFAVLTVLGELKTIRAPLGREGLEITTSGTFAFAILLTAGPIHAALVMASAVVVADLLSRKRWWKVLFNATQYVLCIAVAGRLGEMVLGHGLGEADRLFSAPADVVAATVTALAFFASNALVTGIALALAQRLRLVKVFTSDFVYEASANMAMLALGPVAAVLSERSVLLLPLLAIPLAVAYRSATVSVEKEHQALHDELTGLPNRTLFWQRALQALQDFRRDHERGALMLVDLDRFKEVNDTLGHHTGDQVLRHLALRLSALLGQRASVARLGGDEFGVVLPRIGDEATATNMAAQVVAALQQPVEVGGMSLEIDGSVGIALYPDHGLDVEVLMQHADVAMYAAKENHRGQLLYSPALDTNSPSRLSLVSELRRAVQDDQLRVFYQPKVDVASGEVSGVEALVRWHHPTRGLLLPAEFVPVAEQTGVIRDLTEFVLATSLNQCSAWADTGLGVSVAVNVSARMLHDGDLPTTVANLLTCTGVPAERLVLEITESTIMVDVDRAVAALDHLRSLGVELAVDDYGTGHSSLAYLKRLPVNEIKIDKSFITHLVDEERDAIITSSTIELGRRLGLRVVAEGVENVETFETLRTMGCHLVQGYLVSRPLPAERVTPWLLRRHAELNRETAHTDAAANRRSQRSSSQTMTRSVISSRVQSSWSAREDEHQPGQRSVAVEAVPRLGASRRGHQADVLVVAQRAGVEPAEPGHLGNPRTCSGPQRHSLDLT